MFTKIVEWIKRLFSKEDTIVKVFSMEEYLDLVSQYTDSTIRKERKTGNYFTGGECKTHVLENELVSFDIQMYFVNSHNERRLITSKRTISLKNFDEKAQRQLNEGQKAFEILNPEGDK